MALMKGKKIMLKNFFKKFKRQPKVDNVNFFLAVHGDKVLINFTQSIQGLTLTPEQAIDFGKALRNRARKILSSKAIPVK